MKLNTQKRLAARVAGVSPKRVKLDPSKAEEIKESITKADLRGLIKDGVIVIKQKNGISRGRAKHIKRQKSKGRQKGPGSRKGKKTARAPKKKTWMKKIRLQRSLLKELKEKKMLDSISFRKLYIKSKGGYFRSKRHLKLYIEENNMVAKNVR